MLRITLNRGFLGACTFVLGIGLVACEPNANPGQQEQAVQSAAPDTGREQQAARSLAALSQVITEENYGRLGFHSAAEAATVVSDPPAAVYMVRLDQLRSFAPGQDPNALLTDMQIAIYPVRAHGDIHSAMELVRNNGAWETRSYGNAAHARLLDQTRSSAAAADGVDAGAFFEVRVLALNVYFLGHRGPQGLMLTPMLDDAELGLKAGQSRPAAEVFVLLQPAALRHNGLAT